MSEEEIKKPLTKEDLDVIRELIYAEKVFDMSFQNIAKKLLNEVDLKETQLQQEKNKIKEAREYIEKLKNFKIKYVMIEEKELYASENDFVKELIEILDK